jgi:alkylglycerol monooxygenase
LDYILVTPSNHRVHHAQNERYIDKNYGGVLILWDRMFGTFEDESPAEPVVFGVRKPLASWNPFWANLQIYDYLLFDAIHTAKWRDKLGIWFRRTGWRPDDVASRYPKARAEIENFKKFDPTIGSSMRTYVLVQFGVALVETLSVAGLYASRGAEAVLVPCLLLWAHLYAIGILSEGRVYAIRAEVIRLLLVVPMVWVIASGLPGMRLPVLAAAYSILSLAGLYIVFRIINIHKKQEVTV